MPIADGENEASPFTALSELESYSLITRATDSPSFSVHRLVQEVTRRQFDKAAHISQMNVFRWSMQVVTIRRPPTSLTEALRWLDAAFVDDPVDVRNWPVLNPLLPHAQAVAEHADEEGITSPTDRLMNQLGQLYLTKSLHAEAEPLLRRALAIFIESLGEEHPHSRTARDNYIGLLRELGRTEGAITANLGGPARPGLMP